jgi:4-amino-4-deoxychorismate lyase
VLIDGRETDRLPADDRGLAYGDGLFETMRLEGKRVPLLELHLARLRAGCDRLRLDAPHDDLLAAEIERVGEGRGTGIVKLILTRGSGGRGYAPPAAPNPRRIISWHPLPDYPRTHYREGVGVWLTATPLGRNPLLAGLKHLGRLEQVLASMETPPPGCAEGLMRDTPGAVVEGIRSNLFLVRDGHLETPILDQCGVAGVMRRVIIEAAGELEIDVREQRIDLDGVLSADEVFLTSSVFGLWPVVALARPAAHWSVGPLTRALMTRSADRGVAGWAG